MYTVGLLFKAKNDNNPQREAYTMQKKKRKEAQNLGDSASQIHNGLQGSPRDIHPLPT